MHHDSQFDATAQRLGAAIAHGGLPRAAAARAQDLLKRLETPVRIALVGPETRGRAEAVAALLGEACVPGLSERADRPTFQLKYGATACNSVQLASGATRVARDVDDLAADPDAVLITLERPLPALKRMELVDLVTEPAPEDVLAALGWAARRADVFVWWSASFDALEREAWRAAPARLRDHGFLVLRSGVPRPAEADADFLSAYEGSAVGMAALAADLARHVELGRQADDDSAAIFLQKHERVLRQDAAQVALPIAPSDAAEQARRLTAAITRSLSAPLPHPPARPRSQPRPPQAAPDPMAPKFCRAAAAHIRVRARQLRALDLLATGRRAPPIVRHCAETVQSLTEMLDGTGSERSATLDDLASLLIAAEDVLVLLDVEGAGNAQADAIRLLHQLRRTFEAHAAPVAPETAGP